MQPEETVRLACEAGCKVVSVATTGGLPRIELDCGTGWAAARLLVSYAKADASDVDVTRLRSTLLDSVNGDVDAFVLAAHAWVRDYVRFAPEEGELFQAPSVTLASRVGDCDCHARLLYALLAPVVPTRMTFLYRKTGDRHPDGTRKDGPRHVVVQAKVRGGWRWLETTVQRRPENVGSIDALPGEHPVHAAMRAGMVRSDIRAGMRVFVLGGPMRFEKGATYMVRLGVQGDGDPSDIAGAAMSALGFEDAPRSLWFVASDLPPDFPGALRDPVPDCVGTTAWGMGVYVGEPTDVDLPSTVAGIEAVVSLDAATLWEEPIPPTKPSVPVPPTMGAVTVTDRTRYLSDSFLVSLLTWVKAKQALGMRAGALDFLRVWQGESGITPSAKNKLGYGGLNGMGAQERAAVGFQGTLDDWCALSPEAQLPYVLRYYEKGAAVWPKLVDAGSLYLVNFLPAYIDHADEPYFVLAAKDNDPHGWYRENTGLDIGGKGYIEVQDMSKWVASAEAHAAPKFAELKARLAALGDSTERGLSTGAAVALVGFVALLAAVSYTIYRT